MTPIKELNPALAAHHGGDRGGQGGAQQGTGARGEQYLEGHGRSHTLAAQAEVVSHAHSFIFPLNNRPFFRSKPRGRGAA